MAPMNTNDVNTLPAPPNEVENLDGPHLPLNPGIVKVVQLLNANGFKTTDSGDGETHDCACDRPWGYVVVKVGNPNEVLTEALRLSALLQEHGMSIGILSGEPAEDDGVSIQACWEVALPFAFLDVNNIHDRMLK